MPVLYFTRKGMAKFKQDIEAVQAELADMSSRVAHVAETGGDQYHDNPSFNQLTGEIRQTNQRLEGMIATLRQGSIIDKPISAEKVRIGTRVKVVWNGEPAEWYIGGYGESDLDNGILAYNTPLADLILGKKVGEIGRGPIGRRGITTVEIKEISIAKDD